MKTICVEYTYDATRGPEMDELRPMHRAFLSQLFEQSRLYFSGPYVGQAVPGALIIVAATDPQGALELLNDDPFFKAGLIVDRVAKEWNPVIGKLGS